jgi:hypothetical protein
VSQASLQVVKMGDNLPLTKTEPLPDVRGGQLLLL